MGKIKLSVKDIVLGAKGKGLVKIIPEKGFDFFEEKSGLRNELLKEGVVWYINGDGVGKEEDYTIDLNQIEPVY